jgi:hypothetical protein
MMKKRINMIRNTMLFAAALALCSCAQDSALPSPSSTGTGGSLARFAVVGDFLYTVEQTTLSSFDISEPTQMRPLGPLTVGEGVETIFPLNGFLFLGTQSGMFIYQIRPDGLPEFVSGYQHVVSCDPVVANQQYAYVTLRVSGCRQAAAGAADLLEIIDIADLRNPQIVASYGMDNPLGLGLDGQTLFVCLGAGGVKVFDVSQPQNLRELAHIHPLNAIDVIPLDGLLLVIGPDRIAQYDYRDLNDIKKVSEIAIGA